jgi:hypothetical protein
MTTKLTFLTVIFFLLLLSIDAQGPLMGGGMFGGQGGMGPGGQGMMGQRFQRMRQMFQR